MDNHLHDAQQPTGRRKFLRQLGMTAAATAALTGIADAAGLTPASAATKQTRVKKVREVRERAAAVNTNCPSLSCFLNLGHCGGTCGNGPAACHKCYTSTGHVYEMCIGGNFGFYLHYC